VRLSVVVPAFNEERLLGSTLASVHRAAEGLDYELIVCDNNSTDRTAAIARLHGAKVVFEPVNQISRARNTGAAVASGDWLVFIDADSQPSAALLQAMLLSMSSCVGGGSTVELETSDRAARVAIGIWNLVSRTMRWAAGSFVFCQAAAFRQIGGFSTELYATEEIEFSRRLKKLGRLVILHRHPLLTSGRKVDLYSKAEHARFLLRMLFGGRRALRSRESASLWYDGRR
jgi:glycosyltransferase involved in cell wall biosynthesis